MGDTEWGCAGRECYRSLGLHRTPLRRSGVGNGGENAEGYRLPIVRRYIAIGVLDPLGPARTVCGSLPSPQLIVQDKGVGWPLPAVRSKVYGTPTSAAALPDIVWVMLFTLNLGRSGRLCRRAVGRRRRNDRRPRIGIVMFDFLRAAGICCGVPPSPQSMVQYQGVSPFPAASSFSVYGTPTCAVAPPEMVSPVATWLTATENVS